MTQNSAVLVCGAAEPEITSSLVVYRQRGHDVTVPHRPCWNELCGKTFRVAVRDGPAFRDGTIRASQLSREWPMWMQRFGGNVRPRWAWLICRTVTNIGNSLRCRTRLRFHQIVKCGITSEGVKCASCFETVSNNCGEMIRQDGRQCAAVLHWNELSGAVHLFRLVKWLSASQPLMYLIKLIESQCSAFPSCMIAFVNSVVSTFRDWVWWIEMRPHGW